jgi:hypothetical protein
MDFWSAAILISTSLPRLRGALLGHILPPWRAGFLGARGHWKLGTSVGLPELWWDLAAGFVKWMPPSWASAAKARWRRHLCCWLLRSMTTTSNQDYSSIQLPGEKGEENNVVAPSCTTSCVVRLWPLGPPWSLQQPPLAFAAPFAGPKCPKCPKSLVHHVQQQAIKFREVQTPACEWQSATWCLIFAMTQLECSPFLWRNQPSESLALIIFNLCHNATTEVCRFSPRVLEVKPCAFARPTSVAAVEFSYPNLPSPPLHHFQPHGA